MLDISAKNEYGFSINFKNNKNFEIIEATGLNPVSASINSSSIPNYSGSIFNSAYVGNRNIVLSVKYKAYNSEARKELNSVFIPSASVTLTIGKYYIDGYVESTEYNIYNENIIIQISIICLYPYFSNGIENTVKISNTVSLFQFPVAFPSSGIPFSEAQEDISAVITNYGDIQVGCVIKIYISQYLNGFIINNSEHGQSMYLNMTRAPLHSGDEVTIDTRFGKKSITLTSDTYSMYNESILDYLDSVTNWIEIAPGENKITLDPPTGDTLTAIEAYITYSESVGGL